jgi:hypothetical protein
MQKISYTVLQVNSDTTEGRGPMRDHAYFQHHKDAVAVHDDPRFYKRYGVMGTMGSSQYDVSDKDIVIYASTDEYWENHDVESLKARALQKLSPQERRILGLD